MGWLIAIGLAVWWLNGYGELEMAKGPGREYTHQEQFWLAWIAPIAMAKTSAKFLWDRMQKGV